MQSQNRNYWLKSGTLNILMNVQNLIFGFGGFFLLVRILDKNSFGIWSLFVATTLIFETARNGLLQNALIQFISSKKKDEHQDIITASFFISAALTIACIILNICVASYLANLWHYPGLTAMLLVYNLVYAFQSLLSQFQWIEQAYLSFTGTVITNIIRQGGFFFYVLFCFFFKPDVSLMDLVYVQAVSVFVAMTVEYFFVKKHFVFVRKVQRDWVMQLLNYGKFAFGTYISSILSNTINQMMLGAMVSADAAGVYNVALRISNVADIPTNAIGTIVFPQSARRFAEQGNDAGKYLYEKSVGTSLAILIPSLLFLLIFSHFVVNLIAGNKYSDTIPIARVTILACIFNPFQRLFGTILDSMGKPKINFLIILLFTIVNLSLTYVFIKEYSIIGAAYATLVTDLIFFIIMQIILWKQFQVNFLNTFAYAVKFYPDFFSNYVKPAISKK
jgi:O-antigen/teichoic acid export membrane protein